PPGLSADMDAHGVSVTARLDAARMAGHADAAAEIWAAVRDRGRPDLLARAAAARRAAPGISAAGAARRAEALDAAAAAGRSAARARSPAGQMTDRAATEALAAALRGYAALLRAGGYPGEYDGGSLRLLAAEVAGLLADHGGAAPLRAAG